MDEELYLHCLDCGEAFSTIRTAWEHKCVGLNFVPRSAVQYQIQDDL